MILFALFESAIQLVPDGTIFIHIALVLVMVGILNRTLLRPVSQILAERERKTGGALAEAAEMDRKAVSTKAHYETALREARTAKYKLIEDQRAEGIRERERILESLKRELEAGIDKERAVIQSQANSARAALSEDANVLAADIRDQILGPASRRVN